MENNENKIVSWMDEYNQPVPEDQQVERKPKFKLELAKDDLYKTEDVTFLDEGRKIENTYGKSILFNVKVKDLEYVWFVKANHYTTLNTIVANKPVTGKTATVTRTGRTKTDTRWSIKFK